MRTKSMLKNAKTQEQATAALEQALTPVEGRQKPWTPQQITRYASPVVVKLMAKLAKVQPAPVKPKAKRAAKRTRKAAR